MNMMLAVLLSALPAADPPNLDFSEGTLAHWQGDGFSLTGVTATSADLGGKPRTGYLHRTFVVPAGAGTLHCSAFASVSDPHLNILLEAAEREIVPKYVRMAKGVEKATQLLTADAGKPREYVWSLAGRAGETMRIIAADQSAEPGHHVVCGGFRIEPLDEFETREFKTFMARIVRDSKLPALTDAFRSKHFLAVSNADEKFIQEQLERCELMHQMFLNHFRVKGFKLKKPATRLMAALFSSQEGLEAYMGRPMPWGMTGLYHPATNRLVVYDFGRSRALVEGKKRAEVQTSGWNDFERGHALGRMYRETDELRADTNISAIMHEVAHQMSFNSGLLNRAGDLPVWLVEGVATYCEPTQNGFWKGIGEMNPERLKPLRRALKGQEQLLPLKTLVESDQWLHGPGGGARALMGYAQSWALVKMLMEEQPRALNRYCELIHARQTPDHRLADFGEVFGGDLSKLEKRHRDCIKRLAN